MIIRRIKISRRRTCQVTLAGCVAVWLFASVIPSNKTKKTVLPNFSNAKTSETDSALLVDSYDANILHNCTEWFEESFEENLRIVSAYAKENSGKIRSLNSSKQQHMRSFPVIVTAASRTYYDVSQGLLKSIYEFVLPMYKDVKVVFYDLGLDSRQRSQLERHCNVCEVVAFEFDKYPRHVTVLNGYAWKPFIVHETLMKFDWVWWMDTSARIITSDLDMALTYSKRNSVLFFTNGVRLSVAKHTDKRTMAYLRENYCKFRYFGEIEAGFVLYNLDDVTMTIVESWCACALEAECMCPPNAKIYCQPNLETDGHCHRFDQSVLSIILRRLFHKQNDYPLVNNPLKIHAISRGNRVKFFNG